MRVIMDAFGGDNAPRAVVEGSVRAVRELDADIILVGKEPVLQEILSGMDYPEGRIQIRHAEEVIGCDESPISAIRAKKDSSLVVGLTMLKNGEGDGFITAGNTGAYLAGAFRILGRIKGVKRPALTPFIPTDQGVSLIVDAGANNDCKPEHLLQFGIMGSIYMKQVFGIASPRVALVNNGTEENKGNELTKAAYSLLAGSGLNFVGNIEARRIPYGDADVLVCDGFVGNVILKLTEGLGMALYDNIKAMFTKNLLTKLSALMVKGGLRAFKKKMDYTEYGGAPLLGIDGAVMKAHGSSDAKAFYNAIRSLLLFEQTGVNQKISEQINCIGREEIADES